MWLRRLAAPRPVGPAPITRTSTLLQTRIQGSAARSGGSIDEHKERRERTYQPLLRIAVFVVVVEEVWERGRNGERKCKKSGKGGKAGEAPERKKKGLRNSKRARQGTGDDGSATVCAGCPEAVPGVCFLFGVN